METQPENFQKEEAAKTPERETVPTPEQCKLVLRVQPVNLWAKSRSHKKNC